MKASVPSIKNENQELSDLDVLFIALYSLIQEKIASGDRGIIVSPGKKNQRKLSWNKLQRIAHKTEDLFAFERIQGRGRCESCDHWSSVSSTSPHYGRCKRTRVIPVHCWSTCPKFKGGKNEP